MTDGRAALHAKALELVQRNARARVRAPEFESGAAWLNTRAELAFSGALRGRLVLLEFWSASSVRCREARAELAELEREFAEHALTLVAVHVPSSESERERDHVRAALLRDERTHPVVLDSDLRFARRCGVTAWPAQTLVSPDGFVLGQVSGAGQRAVLSALTAAALELYGELGALDGAPPELALESRSELPRALRFPSKLAVDAASKRLWIADSGHHRIVECTLEGTYVRAFGCGEAGWVDGPAHTAKLRAPQGMALANGALLVADTGNHLLRSIDLATGVVSTVAGTGRAGLPLAGASAARTTALSSPYDLLRTSDTCYIAMAGAGQIWRWSERQAEFTPAASGPTEQHEQLVSPVALARAGDELLIADAGSDTLRALQLASGQLGSAGAAQHKPAQPLAVAIDADDADALAYVADGRSHQIALVASGDGALDAYAGAGVAGWLDGACEQAQFWTPSGLALCGDTLLVADSFNHAVRAIDLVAHEVRTLDTASIPLPRAPQAGVEFNARELPRTAGERDHGPRKARLPASGGALELALELGPGESLAPGAPSQYRVLRIDGVAAARQVAGALTGPSTRIEIGVAGAGRLEVQALLYTLDAQGACFARGHRWRVDVELDERAPARALRLVLER
ncbi:MAG: redoxin domain-containing protein [Planctomycetes bacterium]|nr:redoxin domain-containing protein [Planctomycetota bacterium]